MLYTEVKFLDVTFQNLKNQDASNIQVTKVDEQFRLRINITRAAPLSAGVKMWLSESNYGDSY